MKTSSNPAKSSSNKASNKASKTSSCETMVMQAIENHASTTSCPCSNTHAKASHSTSTSKTSMKKTTLCVKANVGWGNQLFIRGEGANLSWEKGTPMKNVSENEWSWTSNTADQCITFKVLVNDQAWSVGDNYCMEAGMAITLEPSF